MGTLLGSMLEVRTACTNLGSTLATVINDADKESFRDTLINAGITVITDKQYPLGLRDNRTEGVWQWDDGTVK